ncbi:MAG: DUF1256 domain-containing protein [Clostridiales bacterium]|jgi:putative sporulation protein YyaC|nr:DUF1256 domain-containing protein [Clostridiales bacterium]
MTNLNWQQELTIMTHKLNSIISTPPIILAMGSDKYIVDCFGPLTGYYLKLMNIPTFVYGCLDFPLNAKMLPSVYKILKAKHDNCPILAIDSMIGNANDFGKIKLIKGGIYPGSGTGKNFPLTGTVALTAIVTDNDNLQKPTRLNFINQLALKASQIVYQTVVLSLSNCNGKNYNL